jgi:pimeloyl-ACP methyl ester carboxylesterase
MNFAGFYWGGPIDALRKEGFRVVVPDQIGFGRSSKPIIPYNFHDMALNTRRLLQALGVTKACVVGHSMGGGVALELAWRLSGPNASQPLTTLTLVAPTPTAGWQPGPGITAFAEQMAQLAAAGDREAAFDLQLTHLWLADGRPRASLNQRAVEHARRVFLDNLDPPWPPPLEDVHPTQITDYARIEMPTLIVTGEADHPEVRDVAAELASLIPRASLTRIPQCGHDIANERPNELAAVILDHITAHS